MDEFVGHNKGTFEKPQSLLLALSWWEKVAWHFANYFYPIHSTKWEMQRPIPCLGDKIQCIGRKIQTMSTATRTLFYQLIQNINSTPISKITLLLRLFLIICNLVVILWCMLAQRTVTFLQRHKSKAWATKITITRTGAVYGASTLKMWTVGSWHCP